MNLKTVYILFGGLIVILLVFGLLEWLAPKSSTDSDWVLPAVHRKGQEVKSSEIDRVEVVRYDVGEDEKKKIVFVRKDGTWRMEEPYALRVQTFLVDNLVSQVLNARRDRTEVTGNLTEAGLKPPHLEVTLSKGDESWTLKTSKKSSDNPSATVNVVSSLNPNEPVVVRASDLDALFKKSYQDYRERTLVSASPFSATAVSLGDAKGKELALEKSSEGSWRFKNPAYGPADYEGESATPPAGFGAPPPPAKGSPGVKDLIQAVTDLRVEGDNDFVAEGVSDADLAAKYGLGDKPETLRIEIKASKLGAEDKKTETSDVLLIGKKVTGKDSERKEPGKEDAKKDDKPDAKKDEKKEDKTEYYYVRMASEQAVVRVPAAKLVKVFELFSAPDKLRDRSLVQADGGRSDRIDAIDIKNSSGLIKLRKSGDALAATWKMYREGTAHPTEAAVVRDLIDALTKKKGVVDFPTDKEETLEFDKPAAVVSLWFEGVQKEEKKDGDKKEEKKDTEPKLKSDKPTVTLTFGKRDRDKKLVYVRREAGEDRTIVRVEESLLDKVTAGPLAFLERKVPTFSADFNHAEHVSKLTLARGPETFEITKEKVGDKNVWKFTAPETLKGRSANERTVVDILSTLATLRPDRLVTEKATDAELDTLYGLKAPAAKATVTVTKDGKSEDWVYLLGKTTDGDKNIFAKQGQRDLVFVVPKAAVEPILTGDLRDLTVLTFDVSKVKSLRLSGWKEVAGVVTTLELEHKGDKKWEAKAPMGFVADDAVVDAFVQSLSHLRATRFVTPKAGTRTALDVAEGALRIEIVVEGQEKPLELTVGAEDPDQKGFVFARTSSQGDVFLLPKTLFDKARERIAYFAKK